MPIQTLGPWPLGADNVRKETNAVFNRGRGPARLITAENVDIDDEGWVELRSGITERTTGTAFKNGVSCAGMILLQDGGSVIKVSPGDPFVQASLVTGLSASAKIHFAEFQGHCFYTNGEVVGKILSDGTATHWGMTVPPSPTLGTTAGDLPAGRYRVVVTLVDADGAESGAPKAAAVVVDGAEDITVDIASNDANATHANIYVSTKDGEDVLWNQKVAIGALPATVITTQTSTRPLRTENLRNPIPSEGIATFLGYMFMWIDGVVFISKGQTPNLFQPLSEFLAFPGDVSSIIGLSNGFYATTTKGLYWVGGEGPEEWTATKLDAHVYNAGGTTMAGEHVQALETTSLVALMASDHGLVIGLPDGQVRHITDDRLEFDTSTTLASFVYRETGSLRQILMLLT